MTQHAAFLAAVLSLSMTILSGSSIASTTTLSAAREAFENPLPTYSSGPLWVWNDLLTDEQVTSTLHDLAEQHVMQAFVHPRPGLMTPYLSEEWFRLWGVALREAEKLGMQLWIYDENSYPSGFAGGHVPDLMPDSAQKGLLVKQGPVPQNVTTDTLAVYSIEGTTATEITQKVKSGEALTTGTYLTINIEGSQPSPWFAGRLTSISCGAM